MAHAEEQYQEGRERHCTAGVAQLKPRLCGSLTPLTFSIYKKYTHGCTLKKWLLVFWTDQLDFCVSVANQERTENNTRRLLDLRVLLFCTGTPYENTCASHNNWRCPKCIEHRFNNNESAENRTNFEHFLYNSTQNTLIHLKAKESPHCLLFTQ